MARQDDGKELFVFVLIDTVTCEITKTSDPARLEAETRDQLQVMGTDSEEIDRLIRNARSRAL